MKTLKNLGRIVSSSGVAVDPGKIQTVVDWPALKNLRALRGFLGLTGHYRKFIKRYNMLVAPLTGLAKKNAFQWSSVVQQAFEKLKEAHTTPPVLALPDFSQSFVIEFDASSTRISVALMQNHHPLAFIRSAKSLKTQRSWNQLMRVKCWESYLLSRSGDSIYWKRSLP